MMNWNLFMGLILLYVGLGTAYSQLIIIRMARTGKVKKTLLAFLLWKFFTPIFMFRMKFNI